MRPRPRRRRLITLASLADVIFLLLLYFILTSTFARHGEIELTPAGSGPGGAAPTVLVQLAPGSLRLNGQPTAPADLARALAPLLPEGGAAQVILALQGEVSAQEMADALVILRSLPDLSVTVVS